MSELKTRFTADDSGYQAAIKRMRSRHQEMQADIEKTVRAERTRNAEFIRARVAGVEASRREYFAEIDARNRAERAAAARGGGFFNRFGRFGAAQSMFISAGRDTLTSLASGAPLSQVIAQQAPQVLQGFSMIGLSLKSLGLAAGAAALALMTLRSGAEALKARQQEVDSRINLGAAQGANRVRLYQLLGANSSRLNEGEASALQQELMGAFRKFSNEESEDARRELKAVEDRVRARLREVIITEQQKKNLEEIGRISTENLINTLEGFDQEKARADEKYRDIKAKLTELSKGLTDPQDLNVLATAFANARKAWEKENADIEKRREEANKKDEAKPLKERAQLAANINERQRHGAYIGTPQTMVSHQMITNQWLARIHATNQEWLRRVGFNGRPQF